MYIKRCIIIYLMACSLAHQCFGTCVLHPPGNTEADGLAGAFAAQTTPMDLVAQYIADCHKDLRYNPDCEFIRTELSGSYQGHRGYYTIVDYILRKNTLCEDAKNSIESRFGKMTEKVYQEVLEQLLINDMLLLYDTLASNKKTYMTPYQIRTRMRTEPLIITDSESITNALWWLVGCEAPVIPFKNVWKGTGCEQRLEHIHSDMPLGKYFIDNWRNAREAENPTQRKLVRERILLLLKRNNITCFDDVAENINEAQQIKRTLGHYATNSDSIIAEEVDVWIDRVGYPYDTLVCGIHGPDLLVKRECPTVGSTMAHEEPEPLTKEHTSSELTYNGEVLDDFRDNRAIRKMVVPFVGNYTLLKTDSKHSQKSPHKRQADAYLNAAQKLYTFFLDHPDQSYTARELLSEIEGLEALCQPEDRDNTRHHTPAYVVHRILRWLVAHEFALMWEKGRWVEDKEHGKIWKAGRWRIAGTDQRRRNIRPVRTTVDLNGKVWRVHRHDPVTVANRILHLAQINDITIPDEKLTQIRKWQLGESIDYSDLAYYTKLLGYDRYALVYGWLGPRRYHYMGNRARDILRSIHMTSQYMTPEEQVTTRPERLKRFCDVRLLGNDELAERAQIPLKELKLFLAGKVKTFSSPQAWRRIATVLNADVFDLLGGNSMQGCLASRTFSQGIELLAEASGSTFETEAKECDIKPEVLAKYFSDKLNMNVDPKLLAAEPVIKDEVSIKKHALEKLYKEFYREAQTMSSEEQVTDWNQADRFSSVLKALGIDEFDYAKQTNHSRTYVKDLFEGKRHPRDTNWKVLIEAIKEPTVEEETEAVNEEPNNGEGTDAVKKLRPFHLDLLYRVLTGLPRQTALDIRMFQEKIPLLCIERGKPISAVRTDANIYKLNHVLLDKNRTAEDCREDAEKLAPKLDITDATSLIAEPLDCYPDKTPVVRLQQADRRSISRADTDDSL